jgi:hypothetical protein
MLVQQPNLTNGACLSQWCYLFWAGILLCLAGCDQSNDSQRAENDLPLPSDASSQAQWFTAMASSRGLNFVHQAGDPSDYFMPRSLGSGTAILDVNQDGLMDVFCLQNAGPNSGVFHTLFIQQSDGSFQPADASYGLAVDGHAMGVAAGDLTNDGYPEILITGYLEARLFLNLQGNGFREITRESGVDNPEWGTSATMLDYNRDGWLDMVIANYVEYAPSVDCSGSDGRPEFCGPDGFPSAIPKLFRHTGKVVDGCPIFEDVTAAAGLAAHPGPGLGVACYDFSGDGWVDIFFADDAKPNRLFVNQQDGRFAEEALKRGIALDAMGQTKANMGVGVGDIDSDGLVDVFVTHLSTERHTLWQQGPAGVFSDRTAAQGLNQTAWRGTGFGAIMADFDNNGLNDLAFVNGDIRAKHGERGDDIVASSAFWAQYAQRNQLLSNDGSGKLIDISPKNEAFCGEPGVGRGLAVGDLNNDGALDLVLSQIEAPTKVLLGHSHAQANWVTFRAILPEAGGRDDLGAEIVIQTQSAKHKQWLNPGASYLCSNDPRIHFGLGNASADATVLITWSDGMQEHFGPLPINQFHTLSKGQGEPVMRD